MLLSKMEEIEREKQRSHYETAEKIKKLLADTVEFSQRTALAAKRGKSQESVFSEDRDEAANERSSNRGTHVIRNLIGTPNDKKHPDPKGASGQQQFMNVVEQQVEDSDDERDITNAAFALQVDSVEATKTITDIHKARHRVHRKSVQLQNQIKL